MTGDFVMKLLKALPDTVIDAWADQRPGGRRRFTTEHGFYDTECSRFVIHLTEPAVGWHWARLAAKHRVPLPDWLEKENEMLFRAYAFHREGIGKSDPLMCNVLALCEPAMENFAMNLRALLMVSKATVDGVATVTGHSAEVISGYETLFFNILDRRNEPMYIQRILYPEGSRLAELGKRGAENMDVGLWLLRAAFNNGQTDVMSLSGLARESELPKEENVGEKLTRISQIRFTNQGYADILNPHKQRL